MSGLDWHDCRRGRRRRPARRPGHGPHTARHGRQCHACAFAASEHDARPRHFVPRALHDDANTLPLWLQETISSDVSLLNDCPYSFANHWANARHLIGDDARADAIEAAMRSDRPETTLDDGAAAMMRYARKLTLSPGDMIEADVIALRKAGYDDGQIQEANQIVGYFNYVNRCLNGLGVTTEGDIVGYYANNSESDVAYQ